MGTRTSTAGVLMLALSAVAATSVSCSIANRSERIFVDAEHSQIASPDESPPAYEIDPTPALILDSSRLEPNTWFPDVEANSIHVVQGSSSWRCDWVAGATEHTLGPETLSPIRNEGEFEGFSSGGTFVVLVGRDNYPPPDGGLKVQPVWASIIQVR
ncbi:MAG: hypothetical protein AAF430_18420 [Myxococcota bacterium]